MKKFVIIFTGCLFLCGCAKVSHLDQLLTLKGLADEQEQLNQYIKAQDRNFERMLEEAKAGTLKSYSNQKKVRKAFGEPVFARNETIESRELEMWLYRYATAYFGGEKIYLYFDLNGDLVKIQYIEAAHGESKQETAAEDGRQEI
ncbi:MAG: hypothetical protein JW847_06410 [Candidatus Omnitrophica bacterium]|nr:hypothetical protein [Candidatus Omnitrophota bacterium]